MLVAELLFYKTFRRDLEEIGFEFNPYDLCVANRMVRGKQQTVRFHVDDLISSHEDAKVNDKFLKWLNNKYGHFGEVKATRGDKHNYLGMTLRIKNENLEIDMRDYVKEMIKNFLIKFKEQDKSAYPTNNNMFKEDASMKLDKSDREIFIPQQLKLYF